MEFGGAIISLNHSIKLWRIQQKLIMGPMVCTYGFQRMRLKTLHTPLRRPKDFFITILVDESLIPDVVVVVQTPHKKGTTSKQNNG